MKRSELILKSLLSAGGTAVYIFLVAFLGFNSQNLFGKYSGFLIPMFVLTLFVVSACITGFLILWQPVRMYLEGLKKEAVMLFGATLAWLALFLILVAAAMIILK